MLKKCFALVTLAAVAASSFSQVATSLSVTGSLQAHTEAYHMVPKTGYTAGSGRGGHGHPYTYYVKVLDQSSTSVANYLLNGGLQSASSLDSFYPSSFSAVGSTLTTYTETGNVGVLILNTSELTSALPSPVAPNYAASALTASAKFAFSLPQDCVMSVSFTGPAASTATYSITGSSPSGDPVVAYAGPDTYNLTGGSNFLLSFSSVGLNGSAGVAGNNGLIVTVTLTQVPGLTDGGGGF